jgi:uncharacterized protein HemY
LALAKQAIQEYPEDAYFHNTIGVVLYRTGCFREAIEELETAVRQGHGGTAHDWFFLAMAHARLGHRAEAREWLAKAAGWLDHSPQQQAVPGSGKTYVTWDVRAELQLIRKEAEALIRGQASKSPAR